MSFRERWAPRRDGFINWVRFFLWHFFNAVTVTDSQRGSGVVMPTKVHSWSLDLAIHGGACFTSLGKTKCLVFIVQSAVQITRNKEKKERGEEGDEESRDE